MDFRDKSKINFDIVVNNNEIYLRFHSGAMFEAISVKKDAFDVESLREYYNMLEFTYNLSSKLINVIKDVDI